MRLHWFDNYARVLWLPLLCAFFLAPSFATTKNQRIERSTSGPLAEFPSARNQSVEYPPLAPGAFPVACSNLAHDTARMSQLGGSLDDYWTGANDRYIGDILLESDILKTSPRVPDNDLYPGRRNSIVEFAVITCYPTDTTNNRPDYLLPDGQRIPHMQRRGQAAILASQPCVAIFPAPPGCGLWPMLVFSHGLAGSPVDGKSIDFLVRLASYGYIVSAPFHGDGRFSRLKVEDVGDLFYIIRNFDRIVELQAMRPFSVKAVIDLMLAHPDFGSRVDAARIGGIGGSMGGATMTWLLGAQMTDNYPRLTAKSTVQDPRIKAAVGYVPYAGQSFLPAFGDDNATAKNVTAPYLSISGTNDTTAPMFMMEQAVNNFRGARYQVALSGIEHTYESGYANDVFGWAIPFFAAYLNGDKSSLDRLTRQKNVGGGLNDYLRIDYVPPTALVNGEVLVDEFYNTIARRHFITASSADKDAIDRGSVGAGWIRTGYQFKAYTIPGPAELRVAGQAPACRFYAPARNTHFYAVDVRECQMLRASRAWNDEGIAFWINLATQTSCGSGTLAVTRLSDSRWRESTSNHRYVTSNSQIEDIKTNGWFEEGVV
ncbi:MAG: hypothetical protein LH481_07150, partial [Burkholderiales bacterium]|nr:hypothetical protein [Burkholderiales bacterium]